MDVFRFPLARVTLFFVGGIIFGKLYLHQLDALLLAVAVLLPVFIFAYIYSKKHFEQRIYFGLAVVALSFTSGVLAQRLHSDADDASHYTKHISSAKKAQKLTVVLREKMKSQLPNQRYVAQVNLINGKNCNGKILLYIKFDSIVEPLEIGTQIRCEVAVIENSTPLNPNQFDYGAYLANKEILAQAFVRSSEIEVGNIKRKDVWYYSNLLRSTILQNLRNSSFAQRELNVLSALILGQQQEIAPDIVRDYQYAGAVHILSVSGLHVGFILLFLNSVLRHLPLSIGYRTIRILVILASLWSFAVIAGLSASVVRAVTMFSFVAIGMHIKRDTNIYHTLLVSILLILLFRPGFLFDVGFQLSYCALFFIVWLQPLFASIWKPKTRFINYLWNILTVSFAAQIGTFPLSVYYFHQFPGLFFITNLVILPGLGVIMAVGIFTVVLAAFGKVPHLVVEILQNMISWLNSVIAKIASLEAFVATGIPFNDALLIACYLAIIFTFIYFKQPIYRNCYLALAAVFTLQLTFITTQWKSVTDSELVIYDGRRSSVITQRSNGKIRIFCSDSLVKSVVEPYAAANFSSVVKISPIANVMYFKNRRIFIMDSCGILPFAAVDIIMLRQSPKINLERLLQNVRPRIVVADRSNYSSQVAMWKATCLKQKIPFHYIGEKGFYKL